MSEAFCHQRKLTAIIVSPSDVAWVAPTVSILRDRGMKVVRLHAFGILAFVIMSNRVKTILLHEDRIPKSWESVRARIEIESPNARIIIIPRGETRPATELAAMAIAQWRSP